MDKSEKIIPQKLYNPVYNPKITTHNTTKGEVMRDTNKAKNCSGKQKNTTKSKKQTNKDCK